MKGNRRWWKRGLAILSLLVVCAAGFALSYAYWLPYALRPIASRYGMTFAGYERLKGGRFALTDVVQTNEALTLRIGRVEGFLPHAWKVRISGTNQPADFLKLDGWRLLVHERRDTAPGRMTRDGGIYHFWKEAEEIIAKLRKWAPKATLLNGIVEHGGKEYTFSVITWDRGVLDASGVWPISAVPIDIKGKLTGEGPFQLSYAMHPLDLRMRMRLMETNGTLNSQLAIFYKENRADVEADFGPQGLIPQSAKLEANNFKLPAELLKLEEYSEVTGTLAATWETNSYSVHLQAHVEPPASSPRLPPADVDLAARGDTNRVRVERATSTIPGLELKISEPLELSYRGRMLSERSEIQVKADLEKIPNLKLKGRIEGKILLEKGADWPSAAIQAGGTNLSGFGLDAQFLGIEARFDWPAVEELNVKARFSSNATLAIQGGADLEARILQPTTVRAEGPMFTNFLPTTVSYKGVRLAIQAEGSISNLQHSGEIELVDFVAPQTQPLKVEASWKAQQFTFDEMAVRARAGPSAIYAAGSGFVEDGRTNFEIRELRLTKGDETYLELEEPARVVLTTNAANAAVEVTLNSIAMAGQGRRLRASGVFVWPGVAFFDLSTTNVSPFLFQSFVTQSLRGLDIETLNLSASWSNGPAAGRISGRFSVEQEPFDRLTAAVDLRLQTNLITLDRATVKSSGAEVFAARGFLPISVVPLETKKVRVSVNDRIDFEAQSSANPPFWKTIADLTDLSFSNVALRAAVRGTPAKPTGKLEIQGAGMEYLGGTNRVMPRVGAFGGEFVLNEQILRVPNFSMHFENQPVSVSGNLRLGETFWAQRQEEILRYVLDNAELHIKAPEVDLSPFTEELPRYLRAQGGLRLDVSILPGRNLDGRIELREIESRPLPKVGVVQDIQADLALKGKEVHIENLSGVVGGETLTLRGRIDISEASFAKGYPDLDIEVKGSNIPLARNPDVILRSDLDLRLKNGTNQIPVVSGTANLRDSFLLSDITKLVPGRVARPERRPPYFTLPQDPLDEWKLDVRVRGENFMRVRSPFFQGQVSANLQLTGTLEEPIALGEAAITSGRVLFPFAALEVRQALVSLTIENPYLPNLFLVAAGRSFGFDIRMEVEGPVDEPVIQFTSVPALTSEQIVLMLTTGQIPRQDFGFSNEDRASKLAFFLGKSLWSKFNPSKPAEERLTIRSGEDVTEQGRQTYEVEYKLNDRWSLVGEYDRFGELNANVKWRVFSR